MRATRLATLAWLFSHVGQETISTFVKFSDLPSVAVWLPIPPSDRFAGGPAPRSLLLISAGGMGTMRGTGWGTRVIQCF
jgi:hypothetical protein